MLLQDSEAKPGVSYKFGALVNGSEDRSYFHANHYHLHRKLPGTKNDAFEMLEDVCFRQKMCDRCFPDEFVTPAAKMPHRGVKGAKHGARLRTYMSEDDEHDWDLHRANLHD